MYPIKVKTCGDKTQTPLLQLQQLSALCLTLWGQICSVFFSLILCQRVWWINGKLIRGWHRAALWGEVGGCSMRGEERKKGEDVEWSGMAKLMHHTHIQQIAALASTCLCPHVTVHWVVSPHHHQGPAAASQHCTEAGSHKENLFWTDWYSCSGTAEQNTAGQRLHPWQAFSPTCLSPLSPTHRPQVQARCSLGLLEGFPQQ